VKRAVMIILIMVLFIAGCSKTGNVVVEKNLTMEEAAELAMNRVYEIINNKDIIDQNGMSVYNATQVGDRWDIVLMVSHTVINTKVYNNGTVKVLPYKIDYTK
jgi:hypothetical protein